MMLPNFLIIGAPRSGTTWIEKNLREHPEVFLPKTKELHFFDRNYEKGIEYYESFFADCGTKKAVGEATPSYLHGAYSQNDIPALIKKHLPDVKMIASLRNPIERAYSRFLHSKARFDRNIEMSFEDKLQDRPEFIAEGMYYDQLQRYYALFPKENILVLLFDELKSNPSLFMQRIYEFIGVNSDFKTGWETVRVNQSAGKGNLAKSPFVLTNLSKILTRLKMHSLAQRVRDANSVGQPPISEEMRKTLQAVYREQNRRLEELIDQDLSHWDTYGESH
jgi:hypothetical protein